MHVIEKVNSKWTGIKFWLFLIAKEVKNKPNEELFQLKYQESLKTSIYLSIKNVYSTQFKEKTFIHFTKTDIIFVKKSKVKFLPNRKDANSIKKHVE